MPEKLYTLTEVSKATGISMPTLQRYKKLYQGRIPSEGKGRTQRYPKGALAVFKQLKDENMSRRGRPRKTDSAPPKKKVAAKRAPRKAAKKVAKTKTGQQELLTLTQIGKETGISYPTLLRYVSMHLKKIPHRGKGRTRRFLPEAVEIFSELRQNSRRGRTPKAATAKKGRRPAAAASKAKAKAKAKVGDKGLDARVKSLEKELGQLRRELAKVVKASKKPLRVVLQR